MKNTGIIRHVDELGRLVLPMELRRKLDINNYDQLEIYVEGEQIILKKFNPTCVFCGSDQDVQIFRDKKICVGCLSELAQLGE